MWHALSNAVWGDGSARNEDISEKEIEKRQEEIRNVHRDSNEKNDEKTKMPWH